MTSLLARHPLEPLSMATSQRPTRRRSARQAFDDEELAGPGVGKKTKVETNAAADQTKDTTANIVERGRRKTKKIVYEDVDDGFAFKKTQPRKPKAKATEPLQLIPEAAAKSQNPDDVTTSRQKPKGPLSTRGHVEEAESKRRRSARLSGDRNEFGSKIQSTSSKQKAPTTSRKTLNAFHEPDEDTMLVAVKKARKSIRLPTEKNSKPRILSRDSSPNQPGPAVLNVAKPRSPTKIALPFADTPIIKRNKELRRGEKGSRRSSAGTRGLRASSLIDSGTSNAVPHSAVDTGDFYKHIAQSILEPRRMKQLLVWCGSRALPEKPIGGGKDTSALMAARAIQLELLEDFTQKLELSDWFSREDAVPATVTKRPNPRNEKMMDMIQELEVEIKRLHEEEHAWKDVVELSTPTDSNSSPLTPNISADLLDDHTQTSILAMLTASLHVQTTQKDVEENDGLSRRSPLPSFPPIAYPSSLTSRINTVMNTIEPTIDVFADGIHQLSQYRSVADRVADRLLASAASSLEARDGEARESAEMNNVGVGEVLGALGKVMGERARAGR